MSRDNIPVFGVVERKDWCSSASRNPFIVLNAAGVNRSMHSRNKHKLERLYHSGIDHAMRPLDNAQACSKLHVATAEVDKRGGMATFVILRATIANRDPLFHGPSTTRYDTKPIAGRSRNRLHGGAS